MWGKNKDAIYGKIKWIHSSVVVDSTGQKIQ